MNCASARCSLGEHSRHHDKARSGDPARGLEVHAQALTQRHMILRFESELPRHAPAAHFDIGRLIKSLRDARVQNVGQAQLQIAHCD